MEQAELVALVNGAPWRLRPRASPDGIRVRVRSEVQDGPARVMAWTFGILAVALAATLVVGSVVGVFGAAWVALAFLTLAAGITVATVPLLLGFGVWLALAQRHRVRLIVGPSHVAIERYVGRTLVSKDAVALAELTAVRLEAASLWLDTGGRNDLQVPMRGHPVSDQEWVLRLVQTNRDQFVSSQDHAPVPEQLMELVER